MSLYVKPGVGITKLSELIIDADKDWQAKGITNLKEVAAAMAKGDLGERGNAILGRLAPGAIGLVLTSAGPGQRLAWAPCGGELDRYIAAWIDLTHAEAIVEVDQSHNEDAPIASEHEQNYEDAPADYIKRQDVAILCPDAQDIVAADQTHNENASITRKYDLEIVVGGASAYDVDDATPYDDETTEAQSVAANDMTLLPDPPAVNDAYYFGHAKKFDVLILDIGTQGAGVWVITWEYWNGGAWVALVDLSDGTSGFTVGTGEREVSHTPQGDWATTNNGGDLPADIYWIRARVSSYTSITTQPLGTQSWIRIIT